MAKASATVADPSVRAATGGFCNAGMGSTWGEERLDHLSLPPPSLKKGKKRYVFGDSVCGFFFGGLKYMAIPKFFAKGPVWSKPHETTGPTFKWVIN